MEEMKSNDVYLDSDGTLGISADVDISKVKRILLTQEGTHYGSMYYLDDSDHIAEVSKKVDVDLISRADVEQTVEDNILYYTHSDRPIDQDPDTECHKAIRTALKMLRKDLRKLSPAQPEPISEAYAKAVMTWLVQYQIKCAELQGRYTPYEVLGWIVNDWRKDNGIDGINQ